MIQPESFLTSSMQQLPLGQDMGKIIAAAINAADPYESVIRSVSIHENTLLVKDYEFTLTKFKKIFLLALGKASIPMAFAMDQILGSRIDENLIVTKNLQQIDYPTRFNIITGEHPVPGVRSINAGIMVSAFLGKITPDDLLICLISGGGSSLAIAPVDTITLEQYRDLTIGLLQSGASIDEINTIRCCVDKLKCGGVADMAASSHVVSLLISDIPGNLLEYIASGPTVKINGVHEKAFGILRKYNLDGIIPDGLARYLHQKPIAGTKVCNKKEVVNLIIGDISQAVVAAADRADLLGIAPYVYKCDLEGEARDVALDLTSLLLRCKRKGEPISKPGFVLAGGETTVTIKGVYGLGGRNTELALAAVPALAGIGCCAFITMATDGEDGKTDAAGAVVTGETLARALQLGLDPWAYLDRHDSYSFFKKLNDLIISGPTGTNVIDLVFMFTY